MDLPELVLVAWSALLGKLEAAGDVLEALTRHQGVEVVGARAVAGVPVELLGSPYYKGVPLPRIPSVHKLGTKSRIAQRTEHATVGRRGTYSHAGQSTVKPRRQYSKPDGMVQHASKTQVTRNWAVIDTARFLGIRVLDACCAVPSGLLCCLRG